LGQLLSNAVSGIALCDRATAGAGEELFAEGKVIVAFYVCESAGVIEDDTLKILTCRVSPLRP
jgi:hypothetical protein